MYQNLFQLIIYLLSLSVFIISADVSLNSQIKLPKETKEKSTKLPPCKACTVLVDSFKKGMEKTTRGKHDGGDAAWEEEKLRNYKTSEIRLVEIQETLCTDVVRGENQCYSLANDNEQHIENWWFREQSTHPDLFKWLCIGKLQVCCPTNHFGPNCDECSDCFGNGKCKGNGTRKGNGKCLCDKGYKSESCNECMDEYYEAFKDETKLLCSKCHSSCDEGGCKGGGPSGCYKCKSGWQMNPESGCFDVNECLEKPNICLTNQFCVNNEGSFSCLDCDRSCAGCDGDGPDMCKKCAENFELRDGKCADLTEEKRDQFVNFTRILTYLGLCIATCVIFQNSTTVAYIVGAAVAIYIAASEYWLNTSTSIMKPQMDTKQLEQMIMTSLGPNK